MALYLVVVLTVLTHTSYKGSKVLVALYAYDLGATPLTIGVLFSMYSLFPALLSVYAGKLSDRLGPRILMIFGTTGLVVGLLLPFLLPHLAMLFVSALLIGFCYIFYTVAVQHLIGSLGEPSDRTRNYSIFSMGVGLTALIGPTSAGFAIDLINHRNTYLMFALLAATAVIALVFKPGLVAAPAHKTAKPAGEHRFLDLVRHAPLRRVLITAGFVEAGLELFNFFVPIYARSIGLSASHVGVLMGTFAVALLVVRTFMPALTRRFSEERVLSISLYMAAATYLLYPHVAGIAGFLGLSVFAALLVISFVLGLALGCGAPLSLVLAYNRSPPGRSGEAIGIRQTVNKVTEMGMPVVFGSLATVLMAAVFWMDAAMLVVGAWLIGRDAPHNRSPGTDSKKE